MEYSYANINTINLLSVFIVKQLVGTSKTDEDDIFEHCPLYILP